MPPIGDGLGDGFQALPDDGEWTTTIPSEPGWYYGRVLMPGREPVLVIVDLRTAGKSQVFRPEWVDVDPQDIGATGSPGNMLANALIHDMKTPGAFWSVRSDMFQFYPRRLGGPKGWANVGQGRGG